MSKPVRPPKPDTPQFSRTHFLKWWTQTVIPLVYDDSLSILELLCKVIHYLNTVIKDVNEMKKILKEYCEYFDEQFDLLWNWFENLDITTELKIIIEGLIEDGTLEEIITNIIGVHDALDTSADFKTINLSGTRTTYNVISIPTHFKNGKETKWQASLSNNKKTHIDVGYFARNNSSSFVLGCDNGDNTGVVITNGEVIVNQPLTEETSVHDLMYFDIDNNMNVLLVGCNKTGNELLAEGAYNSISGGKAIVVDGVARVLTSWDSEFTSKIVICQTHEKDYFIIDTDGDNLFDSRGLNYTELSNLCVELGAENAYCFVSDTTNLNGLNVSTPVDNSGRIYQPNNVFLHLSVGELTTSIQSIDRHKVQELKEYLFEQVTHMANGVIELRGTLPSVEFYEPFKSTPMARFIAYTTSIHGQLAGRSVFRAYETNNNNKINKGLHDGYGRLAPLYSQPKTIQGLADGFNEGLTAYQYNQIGNILSSERNMTNHNAFMFELPHPTGKYRLLVNSHPTTHELFMNISNTHNNAEVENFKGWYRIVLLQNILVDYITAIPDLNLFRSTGHRRYDISIAMNWTNAPTITIAGDYIRTLDVYGYSNRDCVQTVITHEGQYFERFISKMDTPYPTYSAWVSKFQ